MYFDRERNAYIDKDTGEVVFQEESENVEILPSLTPEITSTLREQRGTSARPHSISPHSNSPRSPPVSPTVSTNISMSASRDGYSRGLGRSASRDVEEELYRSLDDVVEGPVDRADDPQGWEDWNLARTLQAFEIEMDDEMVEDPDASDFNQKEYHASRSCSRQLLTVSFLICLLQIGVLATMIIQDGWASSTDNPVVGPPVYTMVRFGAKETGLIVLRKQWWRIISPTMLHAGILHIAPNVLIQLRVGGYLNLVYGTVKWLWIYFFSGIFGVLLSCCFLPDTVGVGSSGALMGMLASWVVWIVFRWNKIPKEQHRIRNCQLMVVVGSIAITFATSAMPNVDWAAHAGGAFQGILWGIILLSNELQVSYWQIVGKLVALLVSVVSYGLAIYYMLYVVNASSDNFDYWNAHDDWH